MSKFYAFCAVSLLAFSALYTNHAHSTETSNDAKIKIVVQVSDEDPRKWNQALGNIKNIQKDLGAERVEVELVAFGPGVAMLKADATTAARVSEAKADGVMLNACQNTMNALKLKPEDMNPVVTYVPSEAGEIVKKQHAGYAYLRP
ncbi:DsrE family protein [Undibacterium sp. SXout20W]|uniref:DsrE family protein n=1 Tax=Undibacterium sp. SXout20W TaxID=3413051 RepID=UPI003BF2B1BD